MIEYTTRGKIPAATLKQAYFTHVGKFYPYGQMLLDEFTPRSAFAPRGKLMHINGALDFYHIEYNIDGRK